MSSNRTKSETQSVVTPERRELNGSEELPVETMSIPEKGITARHFKIEQRITVFNQAEIELFGFHESAVPFQREPIVFLFEIFRVGFERGKMVGMETAKAKMREMLGPGI